MSDSDLRQEEVRGIFAVGMIAIIVAYYEFYHKIIDALGKTTYGWLTASITNYIFVPLVYFWGLYVLLTAVSLRPQTRPSRADVVFRLARGVGAICFWAGALFTLVYGALFLVLLVILTWMPLPAYGQGLLIIAVVVLASLGVGLRTRIRKFMTRNLPSARGGDQPSASGSSASEATSRAIQSGMSDSENPAAAPSKESSKSNSMMVLAFLQIQKSWVRERFEEVESKIESSADQVRSARTLLLSIATFVIPIVLSLISLGLVAETDGLRISAAIAALVGFLIVCLTIVENSRRSSSARIKKEYSPLGYASDVFINAFASTQAAGDAEKGEDVPLEFYNAGAIVFSAFLHQLISRAGKLLDVETKALIKRQIEFVCKEDNKWWDFIDSKRIAEVLKTNDALNNAVVAYRKYCKGLEDVTSKNIL